MNNTEIRNIVFDLGGVLMDFDFEGAAIMFHELGLPLSTSDADSSTLGDTPARRATDKLVNAYINGFIDEDGFADVLLPYCKKGVKHSDITHTLFSLDGSFPASRIEALKKLHNTYRIYLLSNINLHMWQRTLDMMRRHGAEPADYFDKTFLSYEMKMAKPSPEIYNLMITQTGIIPKETIYFDDLAENIKAGTLAGLNACLVEANHIEQCPQYQSLLSDHTQLPR